GEARISRSHGISKPEPSAQAFHGGDRRQEAGQVGHGQAQRRRARDSRRRGQRARGGALPQIGRARQGRLSRVGQGRVQQAGSGREEVKLALRASHPSDGVAIAATGGVVFAAVLAAFRRCHSSQPIMPNTIVATKTMIGALRPARLTSAGPGQIPDRPQPTPNSAEPMTSGASTSLRGGHEKLAASTGALRRRASANPMLATATAPAITKASVASHAPKMSRKPMTFEGSVMPEIKRPSPKTRPPTKLAITSAISSPSKAVANQRHCGGRYHHEHHRRRDRARRKPGKAADAVTGRAAIAHPAAEADQKARDRKHNQV